MTERPRYAVELSTAAVRSLKRLPREVLQRVLIAIDNLSYEPYPVGCKKMVGEENLYRLRVGDWRIIYEVVDSKLVIWVLVVGHRREVYRRR